MALYSFRVNREVMADWRRIVLAGAGASAGLSMVPFSTVIGGGLAGFLAGPGVIRGVTAGSTAGLVCFLPAFAITALLAYALASVVSLPLETGDAAAKLVFFAVLGGLVFCYTVVLSALGGFVGAWIAGRYPTRQQTMRRDLGIE